eukprot:TRINITY_DN3950_c3_g1_i3.p1 TRINITY_DN3950_c3_g1~~TRINITY_DN3950_c3_g1_i3.p1  ORF type:complete len:219 (-),score=24.85 TRINITY_DN3950_c3_g1_i3:343-999(-)
MPLVYSFVARGTTILAEHRAYPGNFAVVAAETLGKLSQNDSRFTYAAENYNLNFLIQGGYTYLVVADKEYGREIPFYFLEQICKEFSDKYGDRGRTAIAHSLDRAFGPRLKYWIDYCHENPQEISKVAKLRGKVDEVKNIMVENIEKVLERGERLELLVDKTDNLRNQAAQFESRGRRLRRKMWWQNAKMKMLLVCIFLVLIFVIFLIICFGPAKCFD